MQRIWCVVGGVAVTLALFVGVIALLWVYYLKHSDFYAAALEFTKAHPELTKAIGEIRSVSRIPIGYYFESVADREGEGNVAFSVQGSNGEGWLTLSGTRSYAHWIIDTARLRTGGAGRTLTTVTSLMESTEAVELSNEEFRDRMVLAMAIQPTAPEPHYAVAQRSLDAEDYKGAETALRMAIQIDATFAPAYNDLGVTLMGLRHYTEALTALAKAEALAPDDPLPQINQAMIYCEVDALRDFVKSRELLAAAAAKDDTHPLLYDVLAKLNRAEGKLEAAMEAEARARRLRTEQKGS